MATSKEKFQLIFEARETASRKIKRLNKELAALGGPKLVKANAAIKKLERSINSLAGTTKKNAGIFGRFAQGIAVGNIAANALSKTLGLLKDGISQLGEAIMVAANVEELGAVLSFVAERQGYTTAETERYVQSLRKSGIAQKETNQALLRAVQGNIDLGDAVKLGRIAQDAATIGQVNSSEAYQTLIDAVVKGRVVLLKSLGIQGTFENSYKKMAKTLGKAQTELTQAEKLQARLNLVFEGGEVIAGAYETAMNHASKQIRSMDRHIQNLQVTIGSYFTPALSVLTVELTSFIKDLDRTFKGDSVDDAKLLAITIGEITASFVLAGKVTFNFGQVIWNVMEMMVIDPIDSAATAVAALVAALSEPWNPDAWRTAGEILSGIMDGFAGDWKDIQSHIKDSEQAVVDYVLAIAQINAPEKEKTEEEKAENAEARLDRLRKKIPQAVTEVGDAIEEEVQMATAGMHETVWRGAQYMEGMGAQVQSMMGSAVGGIIDNMVSGRASMADVFKGIAQDFMSFFIKKALAMIVSTFIPGLGGLLGGMFDTPVNDKMAANQGRDFMSWFTRGALAQAAGGSEMAVGISQTNRIAPVASNVGGGGGGMVVMHVNVNGNVMSDQFVEQTIAPKLRELVDSGKSALSVEENENNTGGRDVPIG